MSLDDETLMAFADGELSEERAAEVAAAVAADSELAARVERLRAERTRLAGALDVLPPPPDRMARAKQDRAGRTATRMRLWGAAIAAGVAGVLVGAGVVGAMQSGRVGLDERLQARGALSAALDGAPSGTAMEKVTALYTVLTADGQPCRAFRMQQASGVYEGVACREPGEWRVVALAEARRRAGGSAQASGGAPAVVEAAVEALKPGDPLTPQAEAAWIKADWME